MSFRRDTTDITCFQADIHLPDVSARRGNKCSMRCQAYNQSPRPMLAVISQKRGYAYNRAL
jgi:hypothetical protein